ncbi:MAG TPA: NADH-quinone oxidoreductase subunit N [Acidimicrobiia bacterium]
MSEAAGVSLMAVGPEVALLLGAVLVLMIDVYRNPPRKLLGWTAGTFLAVAFGLAVYQWFRIGAEGPSLSFGGMVLTDHFSVFARWVVLVLAAGGLAVGWGMIAESGRRAAEAIALVLLAAIGFQLMAASVHLVMTFLALEIGSISLYVLAGFTRDRVSSDEAALKYFLLGSFASAIFIYGVALTFAGTGGMSLLDVNAYLAGEGTETALVVLLGVALLLAGLAFKISAAPFHAWAPDVYQGAPAGVTGFMAGVAKVGGFAALMRILVVGFPGLAPDWGPPLAGLAALSVIVGTLLAIMQDDVRRLLAYSGVAHAGFILIGAIAGSEGQPAVWFYLAVYAVQVVAAFAVVAVVCGPASSSAPFGNFAGLGAGSPFLAASLALMLLAMAGIPLTAGFVGKFAVFVAGWEAGYEWLVVLGLVTAVAGLYFYLRLLVVMYVRAPIPAEAPGAAPARARVGAPAKVTLGAAILVTMVLGVVPGPLLDLLSDVL